MRGFQPHSDLDTEPSTVGRLLAWECSVVEAAGTVIEFWGFKRNQGRVWALLFLRGRALCAQELQEELGLSKGAVSMVVRELEQWGVVHRLRSPNDTVWRFEAETDLMRMVSRVFRDREAPMVARVKADLEAAEKAAKADPSTPADVLVRIQRMRMLASLVDKAIWSFTQTAKFDVGWAFEALKQDVLRKTRRKE